MRTSLLKLEVLKDRGTKGILATLLVTLVSIGFMSVTFFSSDFRSTMDTSEFAWPKLLDNILLMKVIIMPVFIASIAGRSVEIEDAHNMWNLIKSSGVSLQKLYFTKFLYCALKLFIFQIIDWIITLSFIHLGGMTQQAPLLLISTTFVSQLAISYMLLAIHYVLSLKWSNQLISTAISIIGALSGIIFLLLGSEFSSFNPYSWMGHLMTIGTEKTADGWNMYFIDQDPKIFILSLIIGTLILIVGSKLMRSK